MRTFRYMMFYRPKSTIFTFALFVILLIIISVPASGFACTYDELFPPCATEDSDDCYWNAQTMGNGEGRSFVNIDGETIYLD